VGLGSPAVWPCWLQATWLISWAGFSLPVAFLCRHSTFLAYSTLWDLHCSLGFTPSFMHHLLKGCLASHTFFCNLCGSLYNPLTLAFWIPEKPSISWTMPRSATSLSSAGPSWTVATLASWMPGQLSMVK
jgi:hypothetical protein